MVCGRVAELIDRVDEMVTSPRRPLDGLIGHALIATLFLFGGLLAVATGGE